MAATGGEGAKIEKVSDKEIAMRNLSNGTVLVEGIPATLTLPSDPAKTKCFALDPGGNRKKEIPVAKANGGGSKIVLKPEYETVWYEVVVL